MQKLVEAFRAHITSVNRLMNFDRDVLALAIEALEKLQTRLKQHHKLDNPHLTAHRTLEMLRGFRDHDSLRPRYELIFNQALVLLVSYFGSTVQDLFRNSVAAALIRDIDSPLLREQFKMSFRDLRDADYQLKEVAPDLLVQAKDISFQDMQSISRAFKEYLGISIDRSETVNNIIAAQGCRHVIVHAGGVVDERLVRQLSGSNPRQLKPKLRAGERVQFAAEEVDLAADQMLRYVTDLAQRLDLSDTCMD